MHDHDSHDDTDLMESWRQVKTTRRRCQFCKQERDCKHGPDPFLFYNFDEIEIVWLCSDCYFTRQDGSHLPESEDDV